jgi:RNase P/RNase MRP subunit p30
MDQGINNKIDKYNMKIINTQNLNEARKQIQKIQKENPKEIIGILSQTDEFNRKALEIKGMNMLIINEDLDIKDYSKQRNSGLNEVLAEICRQKNITIGIQAEKIANKFEKEKAKSLSRLKQNIMLCKKSGCRIFFLNENRQIDKRELQSLMLVLGASTKQTQKIEF